MESSVFESIKKKSDEKKLSIFIPTELDALINSIIAELKIKDPNLRFNTTSICVDALTKAVKKAQRELEDMKGSQSPPDTIVPRKKS
jgi:hypothetical protein